MAIVIVNRFSKRPFLIPYYKNINTKEAVTDALSTILRLLGEESEAASWLIEARSRMEPVEPYDEE